MTPRVTLLLSTLLLASACSKAPETPAGPDPAQARAAADEAVASWESACGSLDMVIRADAPETDSPNAADAHAVLYEQVQHPPEDLAPLLDAIRAAAAIEHCDWQTDFRTTVEITLPYPMYVRDAGRLLRADAEAAIAEGDAARAAANLEAALRLAWHASRDPLAQTLLSDCAQTIAALEALDAHFASRPGADLAPIAAVLAQRNFNAELTRALRGDVAYVTAGYLRAYTGDFDSFDEALSRLTPEELMEVDAYLEKATALLADDAPPITTESVTALETPIAWWGVMTDYVAMLQRAVTMARQAEARRLLTLAAIDLRTAKVETGAYPPADSWAPTAGSAMVYESTESGGFVLRWPGEGDEAVEMRWE